MIGRCVRNGTQPALDAELARIAGPLKLFRNQAFDIAFGALLLFLSEL